MCNLRHSAFNSSDITADTALALVDDIVHRTTGQRLNDLERLVFLGAWQGHTYEQIYPANPAYVEKSVGYRLWRKLSRVLHEKVSKKRIRGAVMHHYPIWAATAAGHQTIVISVPGTYQGVQDLVVELDQWFQQTGHQVTCQPGPACSAPHSLATHLIHLTPAPPAP